MIDRKALLDVLNLIKPAVAAQDFIPILSYFKIAGGKIMAFNDIHAIVIDCRVYPNIELDTNINCCVSAELLLKTLSTMSADSVKLEISDKDSRLIVHNGDGKRVSKVKIPFLPVDKFPFSNRDLTEEPVAELLNEIVLDRSTMEGVQQCLIAVGKDASHPEHMGVTLEPAFSRDEAAFYSTDNKTISRFTFASTPRMREMEGPVVMPAEFFKQANTLLKSKVVRDSTDEVWVEIYPAYYLAMVGNATLFSRRIDDAKLTPFKRAVDNYWKDGNELFDIPEEFSDAIERAAMLAGNNGTFVKIMDGEMKMETQSDRGEANECINFDGKVAEFWVNPLLVKRMLPLAKRIALLRGVTVLVNGDATFLHLVGHIPQR